MSRVITTHLSERLLLTCAMIVVIAIFYALMARGWRRQQRNQTHIAEPPSVGESTPRFRGIYASTTLAGAPLKRLVVHGLGTRSKVGIGISPEQIDLHRTGARSFAIPRADLVGVSRASGIAGKVVGAERLILLTWMLGGVEVDTGLLINEGEEELIEELVQ